MQFNTNFHDCYNSFIFLVNIKHISDNFDNTINNQQYFFRIQIFYPETVSFSTYFPL